jgi:hypothetical protein
MKVVKMVYQWVVWLAVHLVMSLERKKAELKAV